MAVTIARTAWVDDDGSGSTGTVINNAVKTSLYDQIDGALAQVLPLAGGTLTGDLKFTDNLYDIGKAGATRPRYLHLATGLVVGTATVDALYRLDAVGARARFTSANNTYAMGVRYGESLGGTANFWIGASNSATPDLVFSRSDGSAMVTFKNAGTVQFNLYGAGNLSTDASGNVTASDGRLKDRVSALPYGLADVLRLDPIVFRWKPESGWDTAHDYAGFDARALATTMPLAAPYDPRSDLHTLNDRAILGALVNAIREQQAQIAALAAR